MRIEILDAMLIALLGGALLAPPAHAQDVSGGLRGRVFGGDDPLSQATVEVSGPSLPQPIAVQSDAHGQFRFLSLPVGTYELRLRVVGYRPTRYEGVPVTLGRATDLGRIRLEPFAIEVPELTVRADPVSLDPTSTTTGATLGADQFDALPLDRSFRSVAALAPQATYQLPYLAYGSEGVNIAGGSVWDNAYFVDGVDVTDPFVGSSGTNLPYNFLQAVEVKTGGYEAEYGRALGGVVNMVTPTGGNRFEGQVFTFLSDHRLRTAAIYGNNEPNLDTFTQFDIGLALSGPIRKDRAWFYASYNPIVDDRTASFPGMDPTRDRMRQYRFAGKLTWQPRPVTRLSVTFTGDPSWHDAVAPGGSQAPISVLNPDVVLGRLLDGGGSLSFSASHVVHSRLLLEASASRSLFRRDQLPQTDLGASTPYFLDVSSGVASGGFGGSERFHLGRTALRLSGTRLAGPHSLKVGLEYENTALSSRANEGRDQVGGYIYYLADRGLYIWDRLQNQSDVANRIYTAYAEDSWAISHWLRLNAGLRWEAQDWLDQKRVMRQTIADEWSPRLGLIVTPGSAGVQKIVASAGRFYEQVPLGALSGFYGTGFYVRTFYPQDPRADLSGADTVQNLLAGGVVRVPGLRGEYLDEVSLGYERRLGRAIWVGVHGTYRVLRAAIEDTQIFGDTDVVGNPGRGRLRDFPMPDHKYRSIDLTVQYAGPGPLRLSGSYVLSRNTGNYRGLYAGDDQFANGGSQFDNHDSLVISRGPLPNDQTHVAKLFGSYRLDFGLTAGVYGIWESGTPLSELGIGEGGVAFLRPRGTAGRAPSLWDLNMRLDYQLPWVAVRGAATRVILDLSHIGSPRRPVAVDQVHYFGLTADDGVNPNYGHALVRQPPMSVRLGIVSGF